MRKFDNALGYMIYMGLSGSLYFVALKNSIGSRIIFTIILGLGLIGFIVECIGELVSIAKCDKSIPTWIKDDILAILSVVIASIVTFLISREFGISNVIASALV
ncbi:MAG: hypothetical protein GX815_07505, partial [Clostridiales bacterium]|nr:hypothetical protein [Clostridiales bacterium]